MTSCQLNGHGFGWSPGVGDGQGGLACLVNRTTPSPPVHHQLPEFTQTHVHRVSDSPSAGEPVPEQRAPGKCSVPRRPAYAGAEGPGSQTPPEQPRAPQLEETPETPPSSRAEGPMTGREASSLECCLDSSTGIRNAGCLTWRGEIKPWRAGFQGFLGICSTPGGRGRSLLDGFLGVSRWSGATEGEAGNAVTNTQFFPRREDTAMLLFQPSFSVRLSHCRAKETSSRLLSRT